MPHPTVSDVGPSVVATLITLTLTKPRIKLGPKISRETPFTTTNYIDFRRDRTTCTHQMCYYHPYKGWVINIMDAFKIVLCHPLRALLNLFRSSSTYSIMKVECLTKALKICYFNKKHHCMIYFRKDYN